MEYFYSPIIFNTQQSFFKQSQIIGLNKKSISLNKIYKKNSLNNISKHNSVKIANKHLSSMNDSQKEIKELSDDILLSNFNTHKNSKIFEKKMLIRNIDNTLNKNIDLNNNKKLSKKLVNETSKIHNNQNLVINNCLDNSSSHCYINIIRKRHNNKNKDKISLNNITERNIKINNLIKDNKNIKSKNDNIQIEEYESKIKNDSIYYDKYNELEKELKILKSSVIDYENQNNELKKEINGLKSKKDINNNKLKENLQPIKVNIKEKNNYSGKNNNLELITKENNKLLKEINIYKIQLEEYTKRIKKLLLIIKNKDIYIQQLKNYINDEKCINNSNQNLEVDNDMDTDMDDIEMNELINQNYENDYKLNNDINKSVDKLIIDNEENKEKIKEIIEKIKYLGNPEKEYKQYININLKELNEPNSLRENEPNLKNRKAHNIYRIEKNEIIIQNNINKNNYKIDFQIQKNEINFQNNIFKNNKKEYQNKIEYKIQKNEISIINNNKNNDNNKKYNNEKKLEIININSINYISNRNENKDNYEQLLNQKININNQYDITYENKPNYENKLAENRNCSFSIINERHKNGEIKNKEELSLNKMSFFINDNVEKIKEKNKKRNNKYKFKEKKKIKILDGIDVTEINTSSPVNMQCSISFFSNNDSNINKNYLYLYGLHKDKTFLKFDLINKIWSKQINIMDIEDLSDTFKNNYIYENSIFYNVLNGFLILTGKNTNILYYYNAINETLSNICEFNNNHKEGNMLLDKKNNRIFVFSGKNNKTCEYYSFNDNNVYEIPQLNIDRSNSSFIIHNNKIYCFFGYSNLKEKYNNTIEYIDIQKLDNWVLITDFDNFNIENMATFHFKEEYNYIYLYCGIKYNDDKLIEENIIKFDTETNKINIVKDFGFNYTQYKFIGSRWRKCDITSEKERRFIFEKNTNFVQLPDIDNNSNNDVCINTNNLEFNNVKVLIDNDNNVHYIFYDSKNIEIFRAYYT